MSSIPQRESKDRIVAVEVAALVVQPSFSSLPSGRSNENTKAETREIRDDHHAAIDANANANTNSAMANNGGEGSDSPVPRTGLSSGGVAVITILSLVALVGCTVAIVSASRSRRRDAEFKAGNLLRLEEGGHFRDAESRRQRVIEKNIARFKIQYESATGACVRVCVLTRYPCLFLRIAGQDRLQHVTTHADLLKFVLPLLFSSPPPSHSFSVIIDLSNA